MLLQRFGDEVVEVLGLIWLSFFGVPFPFADFGDFGLAVEDLFGGLLHFVCDEGGGDVFALAVEFEGEGKGVLGFHVWVLGGGRWWGARGTNTP